MNKVRIGIDCDGVLRDFVKKTLNMAKERGVHIPQPTNYDYIDRYEINGKTLRYHIWGSKKWLNEIFVKSPVMPFAKKGYNKFCDDERFEVYIVTAQEEGTYHYTSQWLEENGFNKHKETYFEKQKTNAPADILIDDNPPYLKQYMEALREGYLVTRSYNLDSKFKPRASNLLDAYKQISERYE